MCFRTFRVSDLKYTFSHFLLFVQKYYKELAQNKPSSEAKFLRKSRRIKLAMAILTVGLILCNIFIVAFAGVVPDFTKDATYTRFHPIGAEDHYNYED